MTHERWQRLEPLFQQALELEPPDRSAFLDHRCAETPQLRREVEELLAADEAVKATWPGLTLGFGESSPPRYASAQQLAEDLRCHLTVLPVTASAGDWRYRFGKFLRRHRLRLVLAVSLVAATAFILTAFVQSQRLERTVGLGAAYDRSGQPILCESYARRALTLRKNHLPESHYLVALARSTLGGCLTDLGRYEEAEELLRASWHVFDMERGPEDQWTTLTRQRLEHLQQLLN